MSRGQQDDDASTTLYVTKDAYDRVARTRQLERLLEREIGMGGEHSDGSWWFNIYTIDPALIKRAVDYLGPEHVVDVAGETRRSARERVRQRRETFEAVATGSAGRHLGRWEGSTIKSVMATVDRELPFQRASAISVTIRGQYTSDGQFWKNHGGRIVATRESGSGRGAGGWLTSY